MSALAPGEMPVPETMAYRPASCRVTRLPEEFIMEFELPGKIVAIIMPTASKQDLITALTGVHLPDAPALPGD